MKLGQALFLASPGVMDAPPYAGVKWVAAAVYERATEAGIGHLLPL